MKDHKRTTLKQLIGGRIGPQEATQRLKQEAGTNAVILAIRTAEGLYTVGNETGLTHEQMKARLAGSIYIEIDEDDALLGSAPPDLIAGKDGTVFILPNNNR